jgi:metal-dependent amidase/aminoacylase/carboxypeptidase family protein
MRREIAESFRESARYAVHEAIGAAGNASNVIPDTASLQGSIRTLNSGVATQARETLEHLCAASAQAYGVKVSVLCESLLPGVVNDSGIASLFTTVAGRLLGADNVLTTQPPSMGAEDFADYLSVVPGGMIGLGVGTAGRKITPLHTSTFNIDERALLIGARLFCAVLLEWPKHPAR